MVSRNRKSVFTPGVRARTFSCGYKACLYRLYPYDYCLLRVLNRQLLLFGHIEVEQCLKNRYRYACQFHFIGAELQLQLIFLVSKAAFVRRRNGYGNSLSFLAFYGCRQLKGQRFRIESKVDAVLLCIESRLVATLYFTSPMALTMASALSLSPTMEVISSVTGNLSKNTVSFFTVAFTSCPWGASPAFSFAVAGVTWVISTFPL